MAYTTPPTFSTGNILTAAQLNILSDDINYLNAVGAAPSVGFLEDTTTSTSTHHTVHYLCRYTNPYLHVITNAQDSGILKVTVNGTVLINIGSMSNGYYDHIADATSAGMTLGSFYDITTELTTNSGTNRIVWVGFVSGSGSIV